MHSTDGVYHNIRESPSTRGSGEVFQRLEITGCHFPRDIGGKDCIVLKERLPGKVRMFQEKIEEEPCPRDG